MFQSQLGSIKTETAAMFESPSDDGFNPNLVRLRRGPSHSISDLVPSFQSQLGSIKTIHRDHLPALLKFLFQSQLGSIKTLVVAAWAVPQDGSFNPNLVRLRLAITLVIGLLILRFNPNLVRLRLGQSRAQSLPRATVSIPTWFD